MSESLTEALASLQAAQNKLVEAITKLNEHNLDVTSHTDIRKLIEKILNSDTIYTNEQIKELVTEQLSKHASTNFDEAHPGWTEYKDALELTLKGLSSRVSAIESWMKGQDDSGQVTDLQKAIKAIVDEYSPILSNLSKSYQLALENGDSKLATEINNRITETYDEMNKRIIDTIEKFTASGEQGPKPLEPQLVVSDVIGIAGNQIPLTAKIVTSDESQTVVVTFEVEGCILHYDPSEDYTNGKVYAHTDTVENINLKLAKALITPSETNGTITITLNDVESVINVKSLT